MIDPGAIGTLIIGRGEGRRQREGGFRPDGPVPSRTSRRVVRSALATVYRRVATVLSTHERARGAS